MTFIGSSGGCKAASYYKAAAKLILDVMVEDVNAITTCLNLPAWGNYATFHECDRMLHLSPQRTDFEESCWAGRDHLLACGKT